MYFSIKLSTDKILPVDRNVHGVNDLETAIYSSAIVVSSKFDQLVSQVIHPAKDERRTQRPRPPPDGEPS